MYILFELSSSDADSNSFAENDAMGYTLNELVALKWVADNPEYRRYKYCPNREVKL